MRAGYGVGGVIAVARHVDPYPGVIVGRAREVRQLVIRLLADQEVWAAGQDAAGGDHPGDTHLTTPASFSVEREGISHVQPE